MPAFARAILIQESAEGGLSYKAKKSTLGKKIPKVLCKDQVTFSQYGSTQ